MGILTQQEHLVIFFTLGHVMGCIVTVGDILTLGYILTPRCFLTIGYTRLKMICMVKSASFTTFLGETLENKK